MKIKKQIDQEIFFLFPQEKIKGYAYFSPDLLQNPLTKEDLNDFLSKYYHKNFISYLGEYSWDCYHDKRCFTLLLDGIYVHYFTLMHYLIRNKEVDNPLFYFILDSSDAYKPFSHLISERNFSFLLHELFKELLVFPEDWNREGVIDFLFFPNKETYEEFKKEKEEWFPKDPTFWNEIFAKELVFLEKGKNYSGLKNEEPFVQKVEGIEKYLYENKK